MLVRAGPVIALSVALAGGCASNAGQRSGEPSPPRAKTAPAKTAPASPSAAAPPAPAPPSAAAPPGPEPPAPPDDIPPDYAALVRRTRAEGAAAIDRGRRGDTAGLQRQYTEDLRENQDPQFLPSVLHNGRRVAARTKLENVVPYVYRVHLSGDPRSEFYSTLRVTLDFDHAFRIKDIEIFGPDDSLPNDAHAARATRADLALPVTGTWWVSSAGWDELANRHLGEPDRAHAVDLTVWRDGGTHRGDGAALEDHHAWGQPVYAPAAGVVVAAQDDLPDREPLPRDGMDEVAGNHVVIDLGDGEFLMLGSLRQGSVRVRVGDRVEHGRPLARVGNSGGSLPHLHLHLQDAPTLGNARALPLELRRARVDGVIRERIRLAHGQFVSTG